MSRSPKRIGVFAANLGRVKGSAKLSLYTPLRDAPPDHPFFCLIGRVSAEWAQYEHALDQIIWDLSQHSPTIMACVTGQIVSAPARINAVMALLRVRGLWDKFRGKVRGLLSDTHKPNAARNRIVHDAWFVESSSPGAARYKKMARDEWIFGIEPVEEEHILQTIENIRELHARADELRRDVLAALAP